MAGLAENAGGNAAEKRGTDGHAENAAENAVENVVAEIVAVENVAVAVTGAGVIAAGASDERGMRAGEAVVAADLGLLQSARRQSEGTSQHVPW
jgi:hypothetical protein